MIDKLFPKDREPIQRPSIKFLYIVHSEENAGDIWSQCKDSDVILMELVSSDIDKTVLKTMVGALGKTENQLLKRFFLQNLTSIEEPFVKTMLVRAAAHNKETHFIDVNITSSTSRKVLQSLETGNEASLMFLYGNPTGSLTKYKQYLGLFAEANRERENLVIKQITDLEKQNAKSWSGKKVVVIQGAAHSVMYQMYRRANPDQQTQFYLPKPNYNFNIESEIMMSLNLSPNTPIDEAKYKEGLLIAMLVTPVIARTNSPSKTLEESAVIADRIPSDLAERAWNHIAASEVKIERPPKNIREQEEIRAKFVEYNQALAGVRRVLLQKATIR